jgi:hypothetical protein
MLAHLEEIEQTRCFSLEQANRSLVLVSRIVGDIVEHFNRLLKLQADMEDAQKRHCPEDFTACRRQIRDTFGSLQSCRGEIESLGAKLKDWGKGIVHFPYRLDDREVHLCWRHGEASVSSWHEIGACGSGRNSIDTLPAQGRYVGENARNPVPARRT